MGLHLTGADISPLLGTRVIHQAIARGYISPDQCELGVHFQPYWIIQF